MNRDQAKGTAKDVAGKVQRKVGEATGSTSQQIKGTAKQVEGKLQKGADDVEKSAEDADKGKGEALADNKKQRDGQDRSRLSAMEDYEVKYLAQRHGVT